MPSAIPCCHCKWLTSQWSHDRRHSCKASIFSQNSVLVTLFLVLVIFSEDFNLKKQFQQDSNTQLCNWKSTAVTVSPRCYTPETGSHQLLVSESIPNPKPNVLDMAKLACMGADPGHLIFQNTRSATFYRMINLCA